jgi:hypothetical protein
LRFKYPEGGLGLPALTGNPTQLLLPVRDNGTELSISSFSIRRLEYGSDDDEDMLEIFRPTIFSLQLLTRDLALYHTFLCTTQDSKQVMPPRQVEQRSQSLKTALIARDSFVVSDEFSQRDPCWVDNAPKSQKVRYATKSSAKFVDAMHGPNVQNDDIFQDVTSVLPIGNITLRREGIVDITAALQNLVFANGEFIGEPSMTL